MPFEPEVADCVRQCRSSQRGSAVFEKQKGRAFGKPAPFWRGQGTALVHGQGMLFAYGQGTVLCIRAETALCVRAENRPCARAETALCVRAENRPCARAETALCVRAGNGGEQNIRGGRRKVCRSRSATGVSEAERGSAGL